MLGCGQLALAYVAAGKLQAFMQLQSYIWDQVAGVVILLNANGIVQDFEPLSPILKEWNYKTKNILACSNEAILNEFRGKFLDKNP
jgi:fructose-1,6-bisphosphatase/inositol monophosphatase family enzyme